MFLSKPIQLLHAQIVVADSYLYFDLLRIVIYFISKNEVNRKKASKKAMRERAKHRKNKMWKKKQYCECVL